MLLGRDKIARSEYDLLFKDMKTNETLRIEFYNKVMSWGVLVVLLSLFVGDKLLNIIKTGILNRYNEYDGLKNWVKTVENHENEPIPGWDKVVTIINAFVEDVNISIEKIQEIVRDAITDDKTLIEF